MVVINENLQRSLRNLGTKGYDFKLALEETAVIILDTFPTEQLFDRYRKEIVIYVKEGLPEEALKILRESKSSSKPYANINSKIWYTVTKLRIQCYGCPENIGAAAKKTDTKSDPSFKGLLIFIF